MTVMTIPQQLAPNVGGPAANNARASGRRLPRTSAGGPPPAPQQTPWQIPGATLQNFGPGNDLRGTSIMPTMSPQTQQASGQANTAFTQAAGYQLPTWNSVGPYTSRNTMGGIAPMSTAPVSGANFGAASNALAGGNTAAEGFTNQAASMLQGVGGVSFNGGAASGTASNALSAIPQGALYRDDTGQVRSLMLDRVSNMTTPDRQRLAEESLALLEDRSRGGFEQAQRQLGQRAAALGRIGSGMTTTGLSDLGLARERELSLARRELANETAGLRLSDELDQLGATQSVFGSFAGADQAEEAARIERVKAMLEGGSLQLGVAQGESRAQEANANVGLQRASQMAGLGNDTWRRATETAGLETDWENARTGLAERNEGRRLEVGRDNTRLAQDQARFTEENDRYGFASRVSERDAGWRAGLDGGDFLTRRANALGAREGQTRGFDAADREELRGERTFQNNQARTAQQDRIAMQQFAQWLQTQNLGTAQGLFGTGQTGNPGNALQSMAGQQFQQGQDGYAAAAQLMQWLPYLSGRGG